MQQILLLTTLISPIFCNTLYAQRNDHRPQLLSNSAYQQLSARSDTEFLNRILDNILIPRVVGTENHEKVFNFIIKELKNLKWNIEIDEFTEYAPIFGNLTFKNIIATPNPQATRFLVLACHYDSKYFENEIFVGAIDSAVPCAMILSIAKSLADELQQAEDVSLKVIFFDGEEAFEEWGPKDSIYGARHLAGKMHGNVKQLRSGGSASQLEQIDALVLLDLIGKKDPSFRSFFESTQNLFTRLSEIEHDLHGMKLLKNHRVRYFRSGSFNGGIADDHLPFLAKDVPILHLITTPFPREWHTSKDDGKIVDLDTVNNVNLILKIFICEYLHLLLADTSNGQPEKEL